MADEKILDIDLVSIEDYSIHGKISRDFYESALKETENTNIDVTDKD